MGRVLLLLALVSGCAARPVFCKSPVVSFGIGRVDRAVYRNGRRCATGKPVRNERGEALMSWEEEPLVYVDDCSSCQQ